MVYVCHERKFHDTLGNNVIKINKNYILGVKIHSIYVDKGICYQLY